MKNNPCGHPNHGCIYWPSSRPILAVYLCPPQHPDDFSSANHIFSCQLVCCAAMFWGTGSAAPAWATTLHISPL
ncbi:hypothetical protein E2C01_070936 [Portunus trituberculatus]|uniref:Uncharacterized protein n=1 Tax=Portunus trituberculatus TaxID=210409 RepID=A0A5B7HVJ7_PORTR|nr:hypothetical protein [Portunus trituberculatus]